MYVARSEDNSECDFRYFVCLSSVSNFGRSIKWLRNKIVVRFLQQSVEIYAKNTWKKEKSGKNHLAEKITISFQYSWNNLGWTFIDTFKVPFKRKAWGLRPKSHMILIEIKIEVRYLKKNRQTSQEKKPWKFKLIKYIWLLGQ